jgi:hypothetical protein
VLPPAHVHGHGGSRWRARARAARRWRRESPGGRMVTWSATLGAAQSALLVAMAGARGVMAAAVIGLSVVLALAALLVVATVWLLRLALPVRPRALAIVVPLAFYGAAALASPAAGGVLAATLLLPSLVWARWMPAGTFTFARRGRR